MKTIDTFPSVAPVQNGNFATRMIRSAAESRAGRFALTAVAAGAVLTGCGGETSTGNTPTSPTVEASDYPAPYTFTQVSDTRYGLIAGETFTTIGNFSDLVPPGQNAGCGRPCNLALARTAFPPGSESYINKNETVGRPIEAGPGPDKKGDPVTVVCQVLGKSIQDVRNRSTTVRNVFPVNTDLIEPKELEKLPPEADDRDFDNNPETKEVLVVSSDLWMGNSGYRGESFDCTSTGMKAFYGDSLNGLELKKE